MLKARLAILAGTLVALGCILSYSFFVLNPNETNAVNLGWNEPPALTVQPNSLESIFSDLEWLGCEIVNCTSFSSDAHIRLRDYEQFRRFALNGDGIIFYTAGAHPVTDYLGTFYNGILVRFH